MAALPAAAQVRAGPEFQIAGSAASYPAIARTPSGFVAAWQVGGAGTKQIVGRRFDLRGIPQGAEFAVGTPHDYGSYRPRLAAAANGDFIVTWYRWRLDPDAIFARCFDAQGRPFGPELQVDPGGPGYIRAPDVAARPDGTYLVVWSSAGADGSAFGVLGRVFDRACTPRAEPFVVNAYTSGVQVSPDVAVGADGNFVVAWSSFQPSTERVAARRFDAQGAPASAELDLAAGQSPVTAPGLGRDFAFLWNGNAIPVPDRLLARWYRDAGPMDPERRLAFGNITQKDLASDAFARAWAVWRPDLSGAILMTRVPPAMEPQPPPLQVNPDAGDSGTSPAIASDAQGNLLVSWWGTHAQANGIFGQRFGGVHPASVVSDTAPTATADGNGVLEPGETVDVHTAWRNLNGSALDLAGTLSFRLAPLPPGAAITDSAAAYGTVADGATQACTECYALRLDALPGGRPPGHLDVAAVETLEPDALLLRHRWRVHAGQSFSDVPRGHPFYRAVETALHNGVTGGCSTTTFCGSARVTREQAAVFLLRAKDGASYAPRRCTVARFEDVAASSPFCPWVEELARRGVVSGCGGGNYCPGAPAAREQMAAILTAAFGLTLTAP
jgi:hypothetical protein